MYMVSRQGADHLFQKYRLPDGKWNLLVCSSSGCRLLCVLRSAHSAQRERLLRIILYIQVRTRINFPGAKHCAAVARKPAQTGGRHCGVPYFGTCPQIPIVQPPVKHRLGGPGIWRQLSSECFWATSTARMED